MLLKDTDLFSDKAFDWADKNSNIVNIRLSRLALDCHRHAQVKETADSNCLAQTSDYVRRQSTKRLNFKSTHLCCFGSHGQVHPSRSRFHKQRAYV